MSNPLVYNYIPNVPQGNQAINVTQPPINGNFQDIYQFMGVNHINFNTANTFGNHSIVTYYQQAVAPQTGANEMAIFSLPSSTNASENVLNARYPNNGNIVQITVEPSASSSNSSGNTNSAPSGSQGASSGSAGYQYLSGGLLMKWGLYQVSSTQTSGLVTISFPTFTSNTNSVPIPAFTTAVYNLEYCLQYPYGPTSLAAPYGVQSIASSTTTTFTINYTAYKSFGNAFMWMAIGV